VFFDTFLAKINAVDLMNNKAKAIGMKNTHFVNPTGAENSRLRTFAPTKYKDQDFRCLFNHV
jgi:predicted PhzF superfamily epimerase YddE/YHI9